MKNMITMAVALLLGITAQAKEIVTVKSNSKLSLNYEEFENFRVQIKNKSLKTFDVSVEDAGTNEWVKGFGLSGKGKATVDVLSNQNLILENTSDSDIEVVLDFVERKVQKQEVDANQMITFTLHNSSAKSIPLVIPSVMNPNLSPFSNSGVSLKVGQKIYYKKNGKKKLLFEVDNSIKNGDKIDVAKRIRKLEKKQ